MPYRISSATTGAGAAAPEIRKPRTAPSCCAPRARISVEQVDGVGRHAEQKLGAGLLEPVEQARAARQIVDDQFAAAGERGDQRAEPEIVAERAQRVEHGALQPPVARHHPRRGEQRVVAVHDAFRLAGRAGGERQIHHLVGIPARARRRAPARQFAERRSVGRADARRRSAGNRGPANSVKTSWRSASAP